MCGRFACSLHPCVLQKACTYRDRKIQKYQLPEWREHPVWEGADSAVKYQYFPSSNMSPEHFTPVLFSSRESGQRVLQPMLWGLVPVWHKGDPKKHEYRTINARLEHLHTSKLYRHAFVARKFCVVVAQGFYEWMPIKGTESPRKGVRKQPYFVFRQQDPKLGPDAAADDEAWTSGVWSEEEGWNGPKILMMAGLYDIWHSPEGEVIYSYTIITRDAPQSLKWLHERFPAVLETAEQVEAWLNPVANASDSDVLNILHPPTSLDYYPVNPKVGSYGCQDPDCCERFEIKCETEDYPFMKDIKKETDV